MKKHITALSKSFVVAFVCLLAVSKTYAINEEPVEKRKTYNKTYPLTASQPVSIKNSFGTVVINNYKGSEVKVEVTVVIRANNDARAQKMLDQIEIDDNAGSTISFVTKINNNAGNKHGRQGENTSMEINYAVYMPESNPLILTNEFGKSEVADRSGLTDITQKFGELEVGNLSNVDQITVEFGSINANKLKGGKTTFKYSEVKIKAFSGAVKSNYEFCNNTKIAILSDVSDINISNSYSNIEIDLPEAFGATYDIRTSFGDFTNRTSFKIKTEDDNDEDHGPKFDKDYSGQSGNGACRVKIKSSFGNIKLI